MLIQAKIVTAGPRGNACRSCKKKIKKPNPLMRVKGEFNRFSGHQQIDNFCHTCSIEKIEEGLTTLKELKDTLEKGVSSPEAVNREKTRII